MQSIGIMLLFVTAMAGSGWYLYQRYVAGKSAAEIGSGLGATVLSLAHVEALALEAKAKQAGLNATLELIRKARKALDDLEKELTGVANDATTAAAQAGGPAS